MIEIFARFYRLQTFKLLWAIASKKVIKIMKELFYPLTTRFCDRNCSAESLPIVTTTVFSKCCERFASGET